MDHGTTGEVDEALALQPPARRCTSGASPYPMADDRVNQTGHNDCDYQVADKTHALGYCSRYDGHRRPAEPQLKNEKRHEPGIGGVIEKKAGCAE